MRDLWHSRTGAGLLALMLLCVLLCVPYGAQAEGALFTPPKGCDAYLTVQERSCRVEHHFTCAHSGDDRMRVVYTDAGPFYLTRIDGEANWVSSRNLVDDTLTETLFPTQDHASMTELLETGFDAFDFEQRHSNGLIERVVGEDRIVGGPVEIDGEPLLPTEFNVTYYDRAGEVLRRYSGAEYVSARHRRFFGGLAVEVIGTRRTEYDHSPVEFIYPGEPGFLSVTPRHGCGDIMSALDVEGLQ